jgi:hypothetical protein
MQMKPIPISAAKRIAEQYGYDQVIVIARKVGECGGEHCTTYGVDKANCDVAARIGDFLKFKVMGWKPTPEDKAELLAAKVRGYFTNSEGHVEIPKELDGDRDLYELASSITTRIVQPGACDPNAQTGEASCR